MDEKTKIGEFEVKKLEYINSMLTDTSRFGNDLKGQLDGINKYLSSTVQLNRELNREESELVEKQMKMLETLGKYNELLKAGDFTYNSIAEHYGELVTLQNALNEKFKDAKDAHKTIWDNTLKQGIANAKLLDEYTKDGDKTVADVKEYLKEILEGTSKLRGNIAAVNIELEKTKYSWSKFGQDCKDFASGIRQSFGAIKDIAKYLTTDWIKFNQMAVTTSRSMGLSLRNIRAYQTTSMDNVSKFAAKYGLVNDELYKFQQRYNEVTGRNALINTKNQETLSALHVLVGDDAMMTAIDEFDKLGGGIQTASAYMMKQQDVAVKMGLSAQQSVAVMNKNMGMMNRYSFKNGVNGFQRMAILSQQLRFNMEAIGSSIEKAASLEGSIDMAASMQVLGGSYAAQFGNPLQVLYESLNDAEGFANRIINTFASKGNFNRETGMVEISAYNKAMMREAAKNLGMSYEEALNMANQSAKRSAAMREINPSVRDKDKRDMLANLAQYDVEQRKFTVTYFDKNNKETTKLISEINPDDISYIKNNIVDDDLNKNVKGIYSIMRERFATKAAESVSMEENLKGAENAWSATKASVVDSRMISIDERIKEWADNWSKLNLGDRKMYGGIGLALGSIGKVLTMIGGGYASYKVLRGIGGRVFGYSGGSGQQPILPSESTQTVQTQTSGAHKFSGYRIQKNGNIRVPGGGIIQGNSARGKILKEQILASRGGAGTFGRTMAGTRAASALRVTRGAGIASGVLSGVATGIEEFGGENNHTTGQKVAITAGSAIGGGLGAWGGAALGASIGSAVPVVGTIVGGILGAALGYAGSKLGGKLAGAITGADMSETPVQPQPLDNTTAGQMVSGDIDLNVHGTIRIQYPNGASQDLVRELQRPDIQNAIKNIVVREMAKANAGGAIVNRGSQEMIRQGA